MNKRKRLVWFIVLAAVLAASVAGVMSSAVWNEEQAVQFTAAKYSGVEDSTLLVGTHLIHLSALNDAIYATARKSAEESGQQNVYYKSEMADGAWFDITTAASLADITTGGTPVPPDALTGLYLTHHTKSDGKTYALRTGQQVSLQDINDPYNLEGLDELFPLRNQYELLREQQRDSAAGRKKIDRIEQIYALELHNDTTGQADQWLAALQRYYNVLADNDGGAEEMDAVQRVMDAADAERRVAVYTIVEAELKAYLAELTSMADTQNEDGETVAAEGGDSALQAAANESYANITSALIEYEGKLLDPGMTIASEETYSLSQQLIVEAMADNHSACDVVVAKLLALGNIQKGAVVDRETELGELNDVLLPKSADAYVAVLQSGETAEYRTAKAGQSAQALLASLRKQGVSKANTARAELEAYIEAACLRLTNAEGMRFLDTRLEQALTYHDKVADDDFSEEMDGTVDAHIAFLQQKKRALEQNAGGNELDKKLAEKSSLQMQRMSALDKNDLTGAKALEEQIAALDTAIGALQAEQSSALAALQKQRSDLQKQINAAGDDADTAKLQSQLNALDAELAGVRAVMTDGSVGSLIGTLQKECADIIDTGNNDKAALGTLSDKLRTLGSLLDGNAAAVFPVLKELHGKMAFARDVNGDNSYNDALELVEGFILDGALAYEDALRADRPVDALNALLDGATLSGLDAEQQAVARVAALSAYAVQTGSKNAQTEAAAAANRALAVGNPYVFGALSDGVADFIPTQVLGIASGMRHVWNNRYQAATLARGLDYYTFSAYSDIVERDKTGDKVEYLSRPTKYKNAIYVPEDYAMEQFGTQCEPVFGTDLAVALNETMTAAAGQLLAALLAG
ncbi:MAG: DUF4407 domain-containing protein [Agathobaculum sp.]|uniref:hypothetical protein n=1 Tax=Agathobaculum sp. TaxID=2048138 RepID=UPI0025BFB1D7|nr:hypothetical protein [Agathobaculum sp.]MCI7125159.1 DUF4407 domain-containing protein [Agathobaculum sp.]